MTETQSGEATRGLAFALGAYLFWGLQPIFMKAVAHIPAFEAVMSAYAPFTPSNSEQR